MSDLGTARGRVIIDPSGAVRGYGIAKKADNDYHDTAQKNSQKTGRAFSTVGKVTAGAGLVIAGGLALATKTAADFEQRISAIGAVSGASEKQLEGIRKKALQLGADTVFSAKEAALAMEELVKAGVPLADVMTGAADATVNLAAAGEVELAEAAEIAGNALNNFNLTGKDMVRVADLIAGAANASSIDVHDFGESMKQAGAAAALVGFSFEDMAVGITAMGNAGIKGSDAGTSLKTFLLNLQPTTVKQTKLFKLLGLTTEEGANKFFDAEGNIKSLAEIAGVLNTALEGMTKQQKLAALETLFGSDAIRAAAVISKEGASGIRELSGELTKVSAADVAKKKMDNLAGSIEALKGSFETILIVLGTGFQPIIRTVADTLTELGNKFLALDPSTQKLIGTIAAASAVVLLLVGGIAALVGAIITGGPLVVGLGAVIGAIVSPVGLVIAALIALGVGLFVLYKKNETFRNAVQAAWEWIQANVVPVIEQIVLGFQALVSAFQGGGVTSDGFVGHMERVGVALRAAAQWITGTLIPALVAFGGWITGTAVPAIVRFAHSVENILGAAFGWLQTNVFPIFTDLAALVVVVVDQVMSKIRELMPLFQAVFNIIRTIVIAVLTNVRTVITNFVNTAIRVWDIMGEHIISAVRIVFNFVKSFVEGALQVIRGVIQVVTGIISGDWTKVWNGIKNIFMGVWTGIKALLTLAIEGIKLLIRSFLDILLSIWIIGWNAISTALSVVWTAIKATVDIAIAAVKGAIEAGLNTISGIWNRIWGAMGGALSFIWEGIQGIVRGGVNAVIDVINWFIRLINNIPGVNIPEIGKVGGSNASLKLNPGMAGVARESGGFLTNGPRYVVGEGNPRHPEAVIATDPKYRKRNLGLLAWAAQRMGVPGFAIGGIPNPLAAAGGLIRSARDKIGDFIDDIRDATLRPIFNTAKGMVDLLPIPGGWGKQLKEFGKKVLDNVYRWAAGKADEDAARRAAAAGDTGGTANAGKTGESGTVGNAAAAIRVFRRMFPGMIIGGRAPRSTPSDHPEGKALDLMTSSNSVAQRIINRFMTMTGRKYWIWARQIASASQGWRTRRYGGPNPHTDHVHLSFFKKGGIMSYLTGGTLMEDLYAIGKSGQRYMLHRGETVTPVGGGDSGKAPNVINFNLTVHANTPAEGKAAAKAFMGTLKQNQILTHARTA